MYIGFLKFWSYLFLIQLLSKSSHELTFRVFFQKNNSVESSILSNKNL